MFVIIPIITDNQKRTLIHNRAVKTLLNICWLLSEISNFARKRMSSRFMNEIFSRQFGYKLHDVTNIHVIAMRGVTGDSWGVILANELYFAELSHDYIKVWNIIVYWILLVYLWYNKCFISWCKRRVRHSNKQESNIHIIFMTVGERNDKMNKPTIEARRRR